MGTLEVVPCSITAARLFVGKHHRHNKAPVSALFAVGVRDRFTEFLVGVALVGRPTARLMQDGRTAEITRVCTLGHKNACSMLYGTAVKACRVLGYYRVITYTLESESGASLRASGGTPELATVKHGPSIDSPSRAWDTPSRQRHTRDLFGETTHPLERKIRWTWRLTT